MSFSQWKTRGGALTRPDWQFVVLATSEWMLPVSFLAVAAFWWRWTCAGGSRGRNTGRRKKPAQSFIWPLTKREGYVEGSLAEYDWPCQEMRTADGESSSGELGNKGANLCLLSVRSPVGLVTWQGVISERNLLPLRHPLRVWKCCRPPRSLDMKMSSVAAAC